MKRNTAPKLLAQLSLLLVAIIWGSSLIVVKDATDSISPSFIIALRCTISCVLFSLIFFKKLKQINKSYIIGGLIIGACLFFAYFTQSVGVIYAMPGKSAFLSSIYAVLVPFVHWVISRSRPTLRHLAAAAICCIGILLTSIEPGFTIALGDILALVSGFFYAAQIAAIDKYGDGLDPILISITQFGGCAVIAWIVCLFTERGVPALPVSALGDVMYLAVMCTGVALVLQTVGQKQVDPTGAAIIMSLESVFGMLFSILLCGEELTVKLALGFALILFAVVLSQVQLPSRRIRAGSAGSP